MSCADIYAGDEAWEEWFDLCSVHRCQTRHVEPLAGQIRSAMFAQLVRYGYPTSVVGDDDPVAFFDSYFMAKGSRDVKKPLKSYFRHRMAGDGTPLRKFVCGTLFSASVGRIHDIVRDWIASVRGWKPHSLLGADGKRHLHWESACAKEDAREFAGWCSSQPGRRLDRAVLRGYVGQMLDEVSAKVKAEKRGVAFLFMATAKGIPASSPQVLAALGVRKSRAAEIKEACMKTAERFFRDREVEANDLAFAETMIAVCEAAAGKEARK